MSAKIYLNPEIVSGLGEDTFWTWFAREAGAEIGEPKTVSRNDIILHYSTKGRPRHPMNTVTLLWELYPEMRLRLNQSFSGKIRKINKSLIARWGVVPTQYSRAFYNLDTTVLPIALDTSLFSPGDKVQAKISLGLDPNRPAAFWSGANHVMKGPDLRDAFFQSNPDWQAVVVQKENPISQEDLALRMRASDGFLNTSRLVPFYMVDWECLAVGLPMIEAGGISREYSIQAVNSREFVFEMKWDRKSALELWLEFLDKCRVELSK